MMSLPNIKGWRGAISPNARRVLNYALPERLRFARVGLLALFYLPLSLVEPYLLMYLVDRVLIAGRPDLLAPFAVRIIPIFILASSVEFLMTYSVLDISRRLHKVVKASQLENLLQKSITFFRGIPSGKVLFSFFNDSNQIGALLSVGLSTVVMNIFFVVLRLGILGYLDALLLLTYLAVIPFQAVVVWRTMKIAMRLEIELKNRDEDLTSKIESILHGVVSMKSFGFTQSLTEIWKRLFAARLNVDFRNMMWKELGSLIVVNFQAIGMFAIFFVGVYKISDGELTLGTLLAFSAVAGRVTPSISMLIGFMVGIQESMVNIERYYRVYDLPSEAQEFERSMVSAGGLGQRELGKSDLETIEVHSPVVDLGNGATVRVPAEFSMQMGESYLWRGPNGAGKTSLALAMVGLLPHSRGGIQFSGANLAEFSLDSIRGQILYSGAQPFWPERSLAENFANCDGPAELDEERLAEAMRISSADKVIDALPMGMASTLTEDAHILSRGENQRLGLALMIYRQPRVLILDESLSNVSDRHTRHILSELSHLRDRCCVIHVSQRKEIRELVDRTFEFGPAGMT